MRIGTRLAGLSVVLGVIVACGGEDGKKGDPGADGLPGADGESGQAALVNVVSGEPEECENGGVILEYGVDADDDAKLDASEVSGTQAICHGAEGAEGADGADGEDGEAGPSGHSALADVNAEPAGENCEFGGQRLDLGTDLDDSGTLEAGEITSTSYACNGKDGEDGEDGEDGAPGATGEQGPSGADGHDHLFSTSDEDPGLNCVAGGKRIDSGTDDDDDGVLDTEEIDATDYVCHGENGTDGHSALVTVSDEMAGANCTAGGKRIESGTDDDGNGALAAPEVDATAFVCDGTNGTNALVATAIEAAGSNCAAGGTKITVGQDDNGDDVLDAGEVDGTSYVCNGTAGFVTGFSGQIGPTFVGWTQCEGYRDAAATEDVPVEWGNDCVATQYTKVKLVCGASTGAYRYIDVNKNPFRDGLTGYPETGLITESKDQAGATFAILENSIWAYANHPHQGVSWWGGGNGCGEIFGSVTVNNLCSWEVANCFGQTLAGDRYLWVYVQ